MRRYMFIKYPLRFSQNLNEQVFQITFWEYFIMSVHRIQRDIKFVYKYTLYYNIFFYVGRLQINICNTKLVFVNIF